MADEPDNLGLAYLRRVDTKVDRIIEDVRDLEIRMTAVDEALAGVNRRIDRLELRVERIEPGLDLVDQPH